MQSLLFSLGCIEYSHPYVGYSAGRKNAHQFVYVCSGRFIVKQHIKRGNYGGRGNVLFCSPIPDISQAPAALVKANSISLAVRGTPGQLR